MKYELDKKQPSRTFDEKDYGKGEKGKLTTTLTTFEDCNKPDGIDTNIKFKMHDKEMNVIALKNAINKEIQAYIDAKTPNERVQRACNIAQLKSKYYEAKTTSTKKGTFKPETVKNTSNKITSLVTEIQQEMKADEVQSDRKRGIETRRKQLKNLGLNDGQINTLLTFDPQILNEKASQYAILAYTRKETQTLNRKKDRNMQILKNAANGHDPLHPHIADKIKELLKLGVGKEDIIEVFTTAGLKKEEVLEYYKDCRLQ